MSFNVSAAFVQQYSTNIAMLLQQQGSRLRMAVNENKFTGKAASVVEQIGAISAVQITGRHSDTVLANTPHDKRWVYPRDYGFAEIVDNADKLRMLIDPTSSYVKSGVAALGRAIDDEIIAGMFGSNNTGENGSTATGVLSAWNGGSQAVPANTGAAAATGLNIAKLRRAKLLLFQAEVDVDNDPLYMVISAKQHDDLLNEAQVSSLDYNKVAVLPDGKVSSFMGFNFIYSERIPGGGSFNVARNPDITGYTTGTQYMVPFFAKSGLALGMWNDIQTSIDKRPDKWNAMQVQGTASFGATRLEEKRVGFITCI